MAGALRINGRDDDTFMKLNEIGDILLLFKEYPHEFGKYLGYSSLREIHSSWIKYVYLSDRDLTLQAHRNSFKTTCVTVVGAIWTMLYYPETTILIVCKADQTAQAILSEIAGHYDRDPLRNLYRLLGVPQPKSKDRWNQHGITLSTKQRSSKENNIDALGLGSSITGRHYDLVICDDIVTMDDRISRAEREYTKRWVGEIKNIVRPSGHIAYVGTPWHPEDAFSILPEPKRFPLGTVDVPGFTPEKIVELKRQMGASFFAAQYDLIHIADEERLFVEPGFDSWPAGLSVTAFLDPSYRGTNTTALAIGGRHGGRIHVIGYVWKEDVTTLIDQIVSHLRFHGVETLFVESNDNKGLLANQFKSRWPLVRERYERVNKHVRIVEHLKANWARIVFAPGCDPTFLQQITEYREREEPDDAPDALAGLIACLDQTETITVSRPQSYGSIGLSDLESRRMRANGIFARLGRRLS
ncbi:MAG: hypothetical protein K1X70_09610 [Leptospirales bacterium]|nr:hypothetical protein [Leptospirales bacterium]